MKREGGVNPPYCGRCCEPCTGAEKGLCHGLSVKSRSVRQQIREKVTVLKNRNGKASGKRVSQKTCQTKILKGKVTPKAARNRS